jgi:ectoine hydroxylase-related dioxygenase (phytanoyl-CoA dioxygenase family)
MMMATDAATAFFMKWGYLHVPGAFEESGSLRMQEWMWRRMHQVHSIERDNPATWNVAWPATHVTEQQSGLSPARMATSAFRSAADALLGASAWRLHQEWSGALISFPKRDSTAWTIVADGWHWDAEDLAAHFDALQSLFIFAVFSHIEPQGGGTLLLAGSHHLLQRFFTALTSAQQAAKRKALREQFHRSSPYLAALTGKAAFDGDRIAHFMTESDDNGVAVRVIEVTGQPGDAFICHPSLLHAVSMNCRTVPRLMRTAHAQKVSNE